MEHVSQMELQAITALHLFLLLLCILKLIFINYREYSSWLEVKNQALLEALEDWNKSFKSVLDHGVYFDNNVFTLFNQRYVQSEKAIAEAIQGEK